MTCFNFSFARSSIPGSSTEKNVVHHIELMLKITWLKFQIHPNQKLIYFRGTKFLSNYNKLYKLSVREADFC